MQALNDRRTSALRHVEWGRQIIDHQKKRIDMLKAEGRDAADAERLLHTFERTQKVFEYDLAELLRRRF